MFDHPIPCQITVKNPDGSKEKFVLTNQKQGRDFLKKLVFTNEPGFPNDGRLIGATRRVLWERNFGNGLRHCHLAELRALPARIVHNLRTPRHETCFPLTMILKDLVEATAREFRNQNFWLKHGMNQTLLGRRELEELEAALAELEPSFRSVDEEISAAGFTMREILITLRDPNFTKFSRALP